MPLKNHHDAIPEGFKFFQPETNWDSDKHCPWCGWIQLRDAIIVMRMANPRFGLSTNPGVVEAEMDHFNTMRLMAMPGTQHFLLPETGDTASPPNFTQPQRLAKSVAAISRTAVGIGTVIELFGPSAEPVAPALSEKRAQICAGTSDATKCPKNIRGDLLQRFTAQAMKGIHKGIELANDMELKTSVDNRLWVCDACGCSLRTKVHVNLDFVLSKTTPEMMAEFPDFCWIKRKDS